MQPNSQLSSPVPHHKLTPYTTKYVVLGMMSGTSLDGVDLSLASYEFLYDRWTFQILFCNTYPYSPQNVKLIREMEDTKLPYLEFRKKQIQYSQVVVKLIDQFISQNGINKQSINLVGLHGHTIFHQPNEGITVQAGNLAYIGAKLQMDVVGNFRELDVHRGGQGAPLAPFGEELFQDGIYLNLGGIVNVGSHGKGHDITFCNIVLNKYAKKITNNKQEYDEDGLIGKSGTLDQHHLLYLENKYKNKANFSLARQNIQEYLDQIQKSNESEEMLRNRIRTFYQFIASEIVRSIKEIIAQQDKSKTETEKKQQKENGTIVYCTGGGAYNQFLITLLNNNEDNIKFIVPDPHIVKFKEALIFGLLALKFVLGERNCGSGVGGQLVKGKPINKQ